MFNRQYKLFLLSPKQKYLNYPAHSELAKIFGKKRLMIPLALPTIAALTPDHYRIRIIDEETESLPKNEIPDIVGITTLAATIRRAYELGDHFRSLGSKVVLGGPYASFMTEEGLQHADAIVVGEAEGAWEQCLDDFEKGQMKPIYKNEVLPEYKQQKPPRWDLVRMKSIFQVGLQVSRGCPFNCDFCLVSKIFGRKMRYREIDNVVEEIKASPTKYFFFIDDNLTINKRYAKELMKAIKPLGISWGCMSSIDVAKDEELLNLMADAGCFNILIGFESLNPENLTENNKLHNQAATIYEPAVRKIHAAGIHINASFVAGFDHDTTQAFDDIFDFSMRMNLPNVNLHILAAPPGSELYKRLSDQGRLFNCDTDLRVSHFPTIHYMKMSQTEIFDKYMETVAKLYDFKNIRVKAERLFENGAFIRQGGRIPRFMKARLSWIIFKEFIMTPDREKKALFLYIYHLIRARKIAIDKGFGFLITMLGYNRHIRDHFKNMEKYRKMVVEQDRGSWENIQKEYRTLNNEF